MLLGMASPGYSEIKLDVNDAGFIVHSHLSRILVQAQAFISQVSSMIIGGGCTRDKSEYVKTSSSLLCW